MFWHHEYGSDFCKSLWEDSVVFINPGEMHTGSSASEHGWTYRTLYPSIELLQRAAFDLTGRQQHIPFFADAVVHDPEMTREIFLTHRALEEQAFSLERESRLLWTLARLVLRYADNHPRPRSFAREQRGIQRVRAYLDENYAESISLEQLAALANLSPFHLLRSFRDQVGLPPHAYQMQKHLCRGMHITSLLQPDIPGGAHISQLHLAGYVAFLCA